MTALPAFSSIGSVGTAINPSGQAVTSGAVNPGDIAILVVFSRSAFITSVGAGWTPIDSVSTTNTFLQTWWRRVTSAGTVSASITGAASGTTKGYIVAYSKALASGTPFQSGSNGNVGASTSMATDAVTTAQDASLIIDIGGTGLTQTQTIGNFSDPGLTSYTNRLNDTFNVLSDGGKSPAGAVGSSAATISVARNWATLRAILLPQPPNTVVASTSLPVIGASGNVAMAATMAAVVGLGAVNTGSVVGQANAASAGAALQGVHVQGTADQANPAQADAMLPGPQAASTVSATNAASAWACLPELFMSATIEQVNVNPIVGTLTLPAQGMGGSFTAGQAVAGQALLPAIEMTATLERGSYGVQPRYLIIIEPRPFYASLPTERFYTLQPTRSFYIKSDPNMTPKLLPKDPRESAVLTFNASGQLAAGETLTAVSEVDIAVYRGDEDPVTLAANGEAVINPADLVVNNVPVAGSSVTIPANQGVQVPVTGGADGNQYLVAVTCTTSNPQKTLTLKAILPVSDE